MTDLVEVPLAERGMPADRPARQRDPAAGSLHQADEGRDHGPQVRPLEDEQGAERGLSGLRGPFYRLQPEPQDGIERELRVSHSLEQIDALWEGLTGSNLAKGWELRAEPTVTEPLKIAAAAPVETAAIEEAPKMAPSERTKRTRPAKKAEGATEQESAPAEEAAPKMAPSERTTKKPSRKKKSG